MTLEGRGVLVTGGGRGIGAAAAWAFAERGAVVSVAGRNEAQVVEVAGFLRDAGHEAYAFRCDVTSQLQVRDLALSAREAMGSVDVLINNAGTVRSNLLGKVTLEEWTHVLNVNVTGAFLCTQALLPAMVERGWGRVVNMTSVAGLAGGRGIASYSAAKHAIVGLTRSVAAEAEGTGVEVAAVCPGYVDTPLLHETVARLVRSGGRTVAEGLDGMLEAADQPRLLRPPEVAEVIVGVCDGSVNVPPDRCVLVGAEGP